MADTTGARIQHDEPAQRDVETREETVARAMDEQRARAGEGGGSVDPSTRRGVNRTLWRTMGLAALIAFIVGGLIGAVLSIAPGPFETGSAGEAAGYAIGLGAAMALVVAVIAALLTLAREDGRVEREVEARSGPQPPPAGASDPQTDLKPR